MQTETPHLNECDDGLWLTENVLAKLEGAFGAQLKGGSMTQQQIDVIRDMTESWPRGDIVATVDFILRDCERFPTPADWWRLRPKSKPQEQLHDDPIELDSLNRLTPDDPWTRWWWRRFIVGMKQNRLPQAYEAILAEAKKRGLPEHDWQYGSPHYDETGKKVPGRLVDCGWAHWVRAGRNH